MGVKQIPFNSNKAAETVALFIDLMLILGLEVTRSMSVLTGSDCISLYGETTWAGGWNGSDKPEGYCAGLSLDDEDKPPSFSMPAKRKKLPSVVTHQSAAFTLHILLPEAFVAGRKREEVIDIWRISMWRKIQLCLCIFLNIVLLCLSLWEWIKTQKFSIVMRDWKFSPAELVMLLHQAHLYTALTSFLK